MNSLTFAAVRSFIMSLSTPLTSPTMGMSTTTFLLMDVGSMSMCIIFAYGANSSILPVTLSSNLAPMAMRQSVLVTAILAPYVPCIPSIPRKSGSVPGNAPSPINVVVTGMPSFFANCLSSLAALELITPPPAYIIGLFEASIWLTAFLICPGCPLYVG